MCQIKFLFTYAKENISEVLFAYKKQSLFMYWYFENQHNGDTCIYI